jgi:hypothetical protein
MPDENVDVVRRFWDAATVTRDFEAADELVQPDAEFDWSESRAPYAGVYRGAEEGTSGVRGWRDALAAVSPPAT